MDTEEIIDDDENVNTEDKTLFSWKKVLLAPFKALWCVIAFLAKEVWWVTKLALFFAFVAMGIMAIIASIGQGLSDRGIGASDINADKYEWVNG